MLRMFRCAAIIVACLLGSAAAFAQTKAAVTVFVGGAVTAPVKDAGAAFTRSSGAMIVYVSDTTGGLQKRLAAGEHADLIVATGAGLDALAQQKLIATDTRVDLARALIGVAVKRGAPLPDLSTPETFKAALLKSRSVSYVSPAAGGTSGTYMEGLLQKMGIAEAMKPKIVYRNQGSEVADAVATGDAEIGISFSSELQPNPGVRVAGPLPAAIQLPTIYSAALIAGSSNDAARAFLRTLAGAEGRAAMTKAGLEPVTNR